MIKNKEKTKTKFSQTKNPLDLTVPAGLKRQKTRHPNVLEKIFQPSFNFQENCLFSKSKANKKYCSALLNTGQN